MTNLLVNPSFGGPHHRAPQPISGEFPDGWELEEYSRDGDPAIGSTGSPPTVPELIVIEHGAQFPEGYLLYDQSDDWILKCFKQNGAISFVWKQTVPNLPAGRYQFICPVFPDHWHDVDGENRFVRPSTATSPDWYLASECFVHITSGLTYWADWQDARRVPIGQYTVLIAEYQHPGGDLTVRFGARGRWPFKNNCWFFDGLALVRMNEPAPDPEPAPIPAPLPQPGTVVLSVGTLEALIGVTEQIDMNCDQIDASAAAYIQQANAFTQNVRAHNADTRAMLEKLRNFTTD